MPEDLVPDRALPKRPPTMKDIARIAGVAQSTVSRVLNQAPLQVPISPNTRERVLAAARELGYRPNPFARGLRGAASMLLGVIVRDVRDPFFASAIDAIAMEARTRGYSVVLGHAREQIEEALVLAGVLEARQCDAIILLGDMRNEPRLLDDLRTSGSSVVEVWHGKGYSDFPSVTVDNAVGVTAALEHLIALGHTRIAFVGDLRLGDIAERHVAYDGYLSSRGLDAGYIWDVPNTPHSAAEAVSAVKSLAEPPTAIIASTDVLALGVLHGAYITGILVPDDLSVVGFDDIPLAAVSVPALTTVHMPVNEMMKAAVELAIGEGRAFGGAPQSNAVVFQPHLVIRSSTAEVAKE